MKEPIDNRDDLVNDILNELRDKDGVISQKEDFAENAPDLNVKTDAQIGLENDANDFILHKTKRHSARQMKLESQQKKHHKKKKRKKSKVKKVLITLLCVILGLILALVGTFFVMYFVGRSSLLDNTAMKLTPPDDTTVIDNGQYINYNGHVYRYKDTMTSILFIGVDKDELGDVNDVVGTGGQADALYLMAVDTSNGMTTTFQISRSTMCDINLYTTKGNFISTENAQICLSYAYGDGKETSAENCITSVRRLFYGLPVAQSYLALDIAGISVLNDAVGGVTVTSPVTLTDGDTTIFEEGKTYDLYGDDAETFVRKRNLQQLDSNTNRMARQKAYLDSFVSKTIAMTKDDLTTPIGIYNDASPYMVTNLSASKVSYLATDLLRKGVTNAGIKKIPGKDKEGKNYVEYHVDNKKFFKMIVDTFYVQTD